MLGEPENQFSLTRAAPVHARTKNQFPTSGAAKLCPKIPQLWPKFSSKPANSINISFAVFVFLQISHMLAKFPGLVLWLACFQAVAATRYVDVNSPAPTVPYTNWATAARVIQDAVNAAVDGDEVLVTNGVYSTGGIRASSGGMTNRVTIERAITLRSVNGPEHSIIKGRQVPGNTNGAGAIRCVFLGSGSSLVGFTLTEGATHDYGDAFWDRSGGGVWGGNLHPVVSNCFLVGNAASIYGGGSYSARLINCTVARNRAGIGGGAYLGQLENCIVTSNYAGGIGGGVCNSLLSGCVIAGNVCRNRGGGVASGSVTNCTLTGNWARQGGGVDGASVRNSIVFYNDAGYTGANHYSTDLRYSCTTPLPSSGLGNLSTEPELASSCYLSPGSPCRGMGSPAFSSGQDIDGESWAAPPSMGCDEYNGAGTGGLGVQIDTPYSSVSVGFPLAFAAIISGHPSASTWAFGDGTGLTNRPYATHAWDTPGEYEVLLTAFNESYPTGVSASVVISVQEAPMHYCLQGSTNPTPPYLSWETAADNIQSAVDAALLPGATILVGDGIYHENGRAVYGSMTNRVAIDRPVRVQSVNGPARTIIEGRQVPGTTNGDSAIRCVYLAPNTVLSGFTLTNGATRAGFTAHYQDEQSGGGIFCASKTAVLTNCWVLGNAANLNGGGAYEGTLLDSTLAGNSSSWGGGVSGGTVMNCVLLSNSATNGGGACSNVLWNCEVRGNRAGSAGGGADRAVLNSCTVISNFAAYGGGANYSSLSDCAVLGNVATNGGGAARSNVKTSTVQTNFAWNSGGGLYICTNSNCAIIGNSATGSGGGTVQGSSARCSFIGNSADWGGGAHASTTTDSVLARNWARSQGGAVASGTSYNCTLFGNSSSNTAGGAASAVLKNCIIYGNQAVAGFENHYDSYMAYCCTTPLPLDGIRNFSNDPLFINPSGNDFHLQPDSPCINAGKNAISGILDFEGNLRIIGGTVDVGAYEFPSPRSAISYAWLQEYSLATDGSADYTDPDGDGLNCWQEWRCLTVPTNELSALRMRSVARTGTDVVISWDSVPGIRYCLERSTNYLGGFAFHALATNLWPQSAIGSYTNTNAAAISPLFYRVTVVD